MASSFGTRNLKNIDISFNAILTSMKTLINNLPLCHWLQYSWPSNILSPFDINGKWGTRVLPFTSCFFSSWIVVLHRYDTPPIMVLFLSRNVVNDVFAFLHVMNQLPLPAYPPLASRNIAALWLGGRSQYWKHVLQWSYSSEMIYQRINVHGWLIKYFIGPIHG